MDKKKTFFKNIFDKFSFFKAMKETEGFLKYTS